MTEHQKNVVSGHVLKGAASLKNSIVKIKNILKSITINTSERARPYMRTYLHHKFDNTVPVSLASGYWSLLDFVSEVDNKSLDDVCYSTYTCPLGILEK